VITLNVFLEGSKIPASKFTAFLPEIFLTVFSMFGFTVWQSRSVRIWFLLHYDACYLVRHWL